MKARPQPVSGRLLVAVFLAACSILALTAGLSLAACRPGAPVHPSPAGTVAAIAVTLAPTPSPPPPPSPTAPVDPAAAQEVQAGILRLRSRIQHNEIVLQMDLSDQPAGYNAFQILFDADRLAVTGYRAGAIGAELLLENGGLFLYQGNGRDWKWIDITPVELDFARGDSSVTWRLPIPIWHRTCTAVGMDCSQAEVVARLVDTRWNPSVVSPRLVLSISEP
ncbi:MAG: hypothetical protein RQ897_08730 [Thermoflexus sp.]|nr:hypothetical protein [Thermoflexus sp.]MDT7948417.1 hypothetical protein [Thermoflexus sp.]